MASRSRPAAWRITSCEPRVLVSLAGGRVYGVPAAVRLGRSRHLDGYATGRTLCEAKHRLRPAPLHDDPGSNIHPVPRLHSAARRLLQLQRLATIDTVLVSVS